MKKTKIYSLLTIIILATLFGLAGGIIGELYARVYLFEDIYQVPFFGEINVTDDIYRGSNLIIRSPDKVIVEQNTKILETVNTSRKSIVGIFLAKDKKNLRLKSEASSNGASTSLASYYVLDDFSGQGFVVTSDGWIMSPFVEREMRNLVLVQASSSLRTIKKELLAKYVILDSEGNIFKPIDLKLDETEDISFWRIDADALPVARFAKTRELRGGQMVVGTNWQQKTWVSTIADKKRSDKAIFRSSEDPQFELSLVNEINDEFGEGFLFNLNGELLAFLHKDKKIIPISKYVACLKCLLESKKISQSFLGLNYISLADIVSFSGFPNTKKGALIYSAGNESAIKENSPAERAGLKVGDIILAVNSIKINSFIDLAELINEFSPGEKLDLLILRQGEESYISLNLDALPRQ